MSGIFKAGSLFRCSPEAGDRGKGDRANGPLNKADFRRTKRFTHTFAVFAR